MNAFPCASFQDRFENLQRVTKRITSSLNIGDILETIRDEIRITVPHAHEACLILIDPEAPHYTRPLHCSVNKAQVNCHMCKRGREIIQQALAGPMAIHCSLGDQMTATDLTTRPDHEVCEIALPIYDGEDPLAVLNVVTEKGRTLDERDMVLLLDLVDLATNTIINAKKYSNMAREKLTVERILGHIKAFVPETVQRIVEKNPDAPALGKQDLDVSILFLDVADYTRISESLTQEKVTFVIEKYFSSYLDIIYSWNGDVNETAGDGLMAIFQGERRENALSAANAALSIRRRTMEINLELKGMFYPIVVNMGINSGLASVGISRFRGATGARHTFTASGPITNLASRIAAAAVDGDILVGPETAERIRPEMAVFDRGVMTFKNVQQQVHVYSLVPR